VARSIDWPVLDCHADRPTAWSSSSPRYQSGGLVGGIFLARGDDGSAVKASVANGAALSPAAPAATSTTQVTTDSAAPPAILSEAPPETREALAGPTRQPPPTAPPSDSTARPAAAARPPTFTFAATRGATWLSIRVGSSTGKPLFEGLLTRGRTLRYRANTLWVRFGAATNIDVRVGARRVRLPYGTADVEIDRRGRAELVALG
jgi:hypothetical protein